MVTAPVEETLQKICSFMETCYEIQFLEIGSDLNHVHFLVQSVPTMSPSRLAQIIKSITSRELKKRLPSLREELWSAAFWSSGFFINTVGHHGNEDVIRRYIQRQGCEKLIDTDEDIGSSYRLIHSGQLTLF
jgi:putative transposase